MTVHNAETCRWCADLDGRRAIEPGTPPPPPVNRAARQALGMGAGLVVVALLVVLVLYLQGPPPT